MACRLRCVSARLCSRVVDVAEQDWFGRCSSPRRPWTLGANATTTAEVITAIHDAVSPLTALGVKSSYQNEGDAFEADWQEGVFIFKGNYWRAY